MTLGSSVPIWMFANVAFLALYLPTHAYVYYRYCSREPTADSTADRPADSASIDSERCVCCHRCGTENEREFRYCRSCTANLAA